MRLGVFLQFRKENGCLLITMAVDHLSKVVMKAIEVIGSVDEHGQLLLEQPLTVGQQESVRVIILLPEAEDHDDNTPDEQIIADLKESIRDAKAGKTFPISELWDGIDV
jgi:hypothetical protein